MDRECDGGSVGGGDSQGGVGAAGGRSERNEIWLIDWLNYLEQFEPIINAVDL